MLELQVSNYFLIFVYMLMLYARSAFNILVQKLFNKNFVNCCETIKTLSIVAKQKVLLFTVETECFVFHISSQTIRHAH
jgi:hypothetical protein